MSVTVTVQCEDKKNFFSKNDTHSHLNFKLKPIKFHPHKTLPATIHKFNKKKVTGVLPLIEGSTTDLHKSGNPNRRDRSN